VEPANKMCSSMCSMHCTCHDVHFFMLVLVDCKKMKVKPVEDRRVLFKISSVNFKLNFCSMNSYIFLCFPMSKNISIEWNIPEPAEWVPLSFILNSLFPRKFKAS
jgi:hypothetical protein